MKNFKNFLVKLCVFSVFVVNFIFIFSCNNSKKSNQFDSQKLKEPLIQINKSAAEIESEQINAYVKRHEWNVIKTGTGLRYFIYQIGLGEQAKTGQTAKADFEISLLNGDMIYSTKENGAAEFRIGESQVESGLHEGITYMKVGDRAKLILPSHLAHGLIGDLNKIPPRSTIIYDIELIGLK